MLRPASRWPLTRCLTPGSRSRRRRPGLAVAAGVAILLLAAGAPAEAQKLIDFEQFSGPSVFDGIDPPLTIDEVTISGGQVLNAATFLPADPTVVYGTAFFCPGCLPTITLDFSTPVSDFSMLLLNGLTVTVTYTVMDDQGATQVVTLPSNANGGSTVIMLPTDGLMQVTVTGGNGGQWDFLIDNIQYTPGGQFDISFSSFIPSDHVGGPPNARCGFPPLNRLSFEGDNRGFSASATKFRTRQTVSVAADEAVDDDGLIAGTDKNLIGTTRSYAPDALADGKIDAADDDGVLGDCTLLHAEGTASTSDMHIDVTRIDEKKVQVHLHGGAGNPLVFGAPDIDWDFTLEIDVSGSSPTWSLTGDHDGFPAYEIYINGKTIYTYSPGTPPFGFNDLRALFPPLDVSVSKSGTLN